MKKGIIFILLLGFFYGSAQSTGNYKIKFLEINKNNSDHGVAILDNNKLIFTSADKELKSSRRNYNPRKNLFIGDIDFDGEIINIKPVINKNSSGYNETGVSFTNNNKTVYFSRNKYVNKRSKQKLAKNQRLELFKANVNEDGSWSNIKKLPFNKKSYSSGYPVLSSDNSKLYFVSDRLPSEGKMDIFVVDILKNGKFSKPRNLGKNVNTSGNEITPFITEDEILYFSSDGHPGKGKLDVYAVEVFDDSTSEIYQLAEPINSINDDFAYIVNKDNNQGFFTSNRLQGQGFNDLYAFILKEDVRPEDCFITVDGKVRDKDSFEAIPGATVNLYNLNGNLLESVSTYDDGTYKFTVSCDKEYKLIASNDNYRNDEKRIEILEENYHTALHTNLVLSKIHKDAPVYEDKPLIESLQPIYYDFDDATITDKAAKEMDKIVKIMKDNTNLIIEASAFTDSRGSDAYNIVLSQKRAKAAVDYLRSQGVDPVRIKSKGYGESRLINQCVNGVDCKESAHQMNRRTEFNFVNIEARVYNKEPAKKKERLVEYKKKPEIENPKKITKSIESEKDISKVAKVEKEVKSKELETVDKNTNSVVQVENKKKPEIENSKKITNSIVSDKDISKVAKVEKEVKSKELEAVDKNTNSVVQVENIDKTTNKNQVKEEVIVNYNSSIVATNKESNKALNYIEKEKQKVIDKLFVLEKKFESAINDYSDISDSLKIEKDKISKVIESAQNLEETGWSNIIEYKNYLVLFNKRFNRLTGENSRYNQITQNNRPKSFIDSNNEALLSSADIRDKEILEENLRVTNMDVIAMKMNTRGIYQKTNNAKKTELIKVSFKIEQNDKVNSGKKNAYIVLQDPEGKVTQAKGIFKLTDSEVEKKYTDHAIINYNKNDVDVTMYIQKKGNNLSKGVYPVKLFLEGQLVGVSNLDLLNPF
jgi:outer membrane protein OmpA-like peptidoglycan-associated protein